MLVPYARVYIAYSLQVLRGGVPDARGSSAQCSLVQQQKWAARAASFLSDKAEQGESAKELRWDKHYEPNIEHMRGLDHQHQSVPGFGLAGFAAYRVPKTLGAQERCYFVQAEQLPDNLAKATDHRSRACVEDSAIEKERLGGHMVRRRLLIGVPGCGSIGWPGLAKPLPYQVHQAQNRSAFCWPVVHLNGGADALWPRKGPWAGAALFDAIYAAAKTYFQQSDSRDQLYTLCYPFIIQEYY